MVRNCRDLGPTLGKITQRLMANQDLLKLLYFTDKNPLGHPDLDQATIDAQVKGKLVKIIPRAGPYEDAHSMIILRIVNARRDAQNGEFKNILISIEVFVPMTQWEIKNENLRPFAILGETQKSLDGVVLNGLGKIRGGDFSLNFLTDEMSVYEQNFYLMDYD